MGNSKSPLPEGYPERAELREGEKRWYSLSVAGYVKLAGGGDELGTNEAQDGGKRNPSGTRRYPCSAGIKEEQCD